MFILAKKMRCPGTQFSNKNWMFSIRKISNGIYNIVRKMAPFDFDVGKRNRSVNFPVNTRDRGMCMWTSCWVCSNLLSDIGAAIPHTYRISSWKICTWTQLSNNRDSFKTLWFEWPFQLSTLHSSSRWFAIFIPLKNLLFSIYPPANLHGKYEMHLVFGK